MNTQNTEKNNPSEDMHRVSPKMALHTEFHKTTTVSPSFLRRPLALFFHHPAHVTRTQEWQAKTPIKQNGIIQFIWNQWLLASFLVIDQTVLHRSQLQPPAFSANGEIEKHESISVGQILPGRPGIPKVNGIMACLLIRFAWASTASNPCQGGVGGSGNRFKSNLA